MQDIVRKELLNEIDLLNNNAKMEKEVDVKSISNDSTGIFYQKANYSKEQSLIDNEEKVLFKFEWKDNNTSKQVKLTGDFVNWKIFYDLSKENDGTYSLSLLVPKKLIQFKFLVDGENKTSANYSTYKYNEKDINNYVDLTIIEHFNINNKQIIQVNQNKNDNHSKIEIKEFNKENNLKQGISINKENNINNDINKSNNIVNLNTYGSVYPKKNEMKSRAGHIPFHYSFPIFLIYNSKQNRIGNKKYLNYNLGSQTNEENSSYREIFEAPHININHILTNNISNTNYIQLCISQRNRKKVTTLVYYKPV